MTDRLSLATLVDLASLVRDVHDFPKQGIVFKDITTLLKVPEAFRQAIDELTDAFRDERIDMVVGMESRGFIFAAPIAYNLNAGLVPVRKLGKLPHDTLSIEYALEYGSNTLEIHRDGIQPGQRVLLVDDLLATGGTVAATVDLIQQLQGEVVAAAFLIELPFLEGRKSLPGIHVVSLIQG
ncbi:MAG TPA: adenine phosphoribosyltransferase [Chloroflexota bacterium]|nr:adenine phosphoribosyltransferase [Chloroflexota bacterium]